MASSSRGQSDASAALQSPQLQQAPAQATDAVESDAHVGTGDTLPEPLDLPDICRPEWQRDGMPDTEFYRKYPPDPWGEEVSPNARVWKIYRDQQDLSHTGMLEGWNKTLDVLLIFAGLFSAVLTAFLIETYKSLQPDYMQYVAAFLYAATVSHNGTGGIFPALDMIVAPDRFIQTSAAQRWTNGLWFTSLVISLAVALLCILIKQWLDAYDSHVSAASPSPRHWARRHGLYHHGLKKWGVPVLISFLPLLLHLSLFLFFVGLVLFLRPLDGAISYSILGMVSCIAAFYVLSLVLPAWRVECPSYTPLLAQALLAVARATLIMAYSIRLLNGPSFSTTRKLRRALHAMTDHTVQWLLSIQLRTREQDAHETQTITTDSPELDGYVLSTLIQLPIDSNRDIVHSAYAALSALGWSRRTIDVLSREVPINVLSGKLIECDHKIPWIATGFAITSHEQLRRARETMGFGIDSYWYFTRTHIHLAELGRDNFLPRALDIEDAPGNQPNIDLLIRQLQALSSIGDNSPRLPRRSACMMYLEFYTICLDPHPLGLSCFLLLFCAGRFASTDTQDIVRAIQNVHLVLQRNYSIEIPSDYAGEEAYILAVANSLWIMLAESPRYSIDTRTAQIVASGTLACVKRFWGYDVAWAQISGLSAFVRSPTFIQCAGSEESLGTEDSLGTEGSLGIADSLDQYMKLFRYSRIHDRAKVQLEDYWACIATLLKVSWDLVSEPGAAAFFSGADGPFPVEHRYWNYGDRLSEGGPYETQDDWYEPALAAFLDGQNAITTWTCPGYDADKRIQDLGDLARRISIVLCRRQCLGRANDTFVSAFFSGRFLLTLFLDWVALERPLSRGLWTRYHIFSYEEAVEDLAKHCLKLSPEGFMAIVVQLEETGDEGSEQRARAVAFARRIRDGSTPGGMLSAECDADCPCMLPGVCVVSTARARWGALAARFRRGGTEPMTSSYV